MKDREAQAVMTVSLMRRVPIARDRNDRSMKLAARGIVYNMKRPQRAREGALGIQSDGR